MSKKPVTVTNGPEFQLETHLIDSEGNRWPVRFQTASQRFTFPKWPPLPDEPAFPRCDKRGKRR